LTRHLEPIQLFLQLVKCIVTDLLGFPHAEGCLSGHVESAMTQLVVRPHRAARVVKLFSAQQQLPDHEMTNPLPTVGRSIGRGGLNPTRRCRHLTKALNDMCQTSRTAMTVNSTPPAAEK